MDHGEELRYLILAVQREGNRLLTDALRALDLTPSQAEVLQVVGQYQPLTLIELGERLVCETGSPSRLVNSMVEKGLLQKTVDTADRRALRLTLTPAAQKLMPALNEIETQANRLVYNYLDEHAIQEAIALAWKLAEATAGGQALRRRKAKQ